MRADPEESGEVTMRTKRSLRNWIEDNLIPGYCSIASHPRVSWETRSDGGNYCYIRFENALEKRNAQAQLQAAGFDVRFAFWPEGLLVEIRVK